MQVNVEDVSSVKKILHIEIPQEVIAKELDSAYADLKKTAKVKGFRPGKAPRSVLERLYKKDVAADVTSRLIQESFADALKQTDLNVVGPPSIDPPALEGGRPYAYDAEVEVRPVIGDVDFKGLALKRTTYTVDEKQVEAQLRMLQKSVAELKPVEPPRPAREGDSVLIDYEGFKDGKPFVDVQKTENYTMRLGNGQISVDVDAAVVGMTVGETKTVETSFSENHFNKKLAGQTVSFEMTLKDVREEVLQPLDDAFAQKVSKSETLEELKAEIRKHLRSGIDKRIEQELNEQCFRALIDKTDFEIPDSMVNYELEGILTDAERSFSYRNTTMEEMGYTRESLAEKYRQVAEKQVRRHLILGRIIEQEALELTEAELDDGLRDIAASYGQPFEELKAYYQKDDGQLDFLKHTLLEKKAVKLIIDSSRIEDVAPPEKPAPASDSTPVD